ncbi:MAG: OsmC family protein [Rikenellaceae bacterium]
MATLESKYLGELRTEVTHLQSGNKITTDAPLDNNGKGEFFSPTDMLVAALGSCMMTIIGITAKNHGFSVEGMKIESTKVMAANPRRVSEIEINIFMPKNEYNDREKRLIESSAKTCPVENSLHTDIKRIINFIY